MCQACQMKGVSKTDRNCDGKRVKILLVSSLRVLSREKETCYSLVTTLGQLKGEN